jgi:phytol kinase
VTPPIPILTSPLAGLAIVLGLLLLLMLAVRLYQVVAQPHPEVARKLFHTGGGLVALTLPWLFDRWWPVAVMGGVSTVAFLLLRGVAALKSSIGQVLGGVQRRSTGEFCFLGAVVILFVLSGRAPVLFGVPILILAIADASAALVGIRYGQVHFPTVEGGRKSAEGSLTFLLTAFLCVHVPLLLWTDIGRAESLLIAMNVAMMAMMAEAIAWRGLDNFVIPFFGYVLLRTYLPMRVPQLSLQLAVLAGLFAFVYLWRRHTNMAANARLGGVMFGYLVWLLAGWIWLVPPVLLFSTYRALTKTVDRDVTRHINFPVLSSVLLPPLLWVVLQWHFHAALFFAGYNAIIASQLAVIALVRHKHAEPGIGWIAVVSINAGKGVLFMVPPIALAAGLGLGSVRYLAESMGTVIVATVGFSRLQPALETYPIDAARWIRQAFCVMGASFLCFLAPLSQILGRLVASAGP